MSRYDGLIIPRSYSEYINKTDAATLQQALQLSGVLSGTVAAGDNKAVKSSAVNSAFNYSAFNLTATSDNENITVNSVTCKKNANTYCLYIKVNTAVTIAKGSSVTLTLSQNILNTTYKIRDTTVFASNILYIYSSGNNNICIRPMLDDWKENQPIEIVLFFSI